MVHGEKGHHFCKLCGKYFTSSQRWSNHMKQNHGDSKPYKCDICNVGFTQQADVQRHSDRIHKKSRPFQCNSCDEKFARHYELTQHQKNAHFETILLIENTENVPISDKIVTEEQVSYLHFDMKS